MASRFARFFSKLSPASTAARVCILAMLAAVGTARSASAQQTFYDDFGNGEPSQYWQVVTSASDLAIDENEGRLEFSTTPDAGLVQRHFAGYQASGWSMRTTSNFFVRMLVRTNPVQVGSTTNSEQGVVVGFGESEQPLLASGFPVGGAVFRFGAWRKNANTVLRRIECSRYDQNGAELPIWNPFITVLPDEPLSFYVNGIDSAAAYAFDFDVTAQPVYFRYATASDTLFVSFFGFNDPDALIVPNLTQGKRYPIALSLGGFAKTPGTLAGSNAWIDSLGVESATIDAAPGNVAASDGTYTDKVRVTWNGAPNAVGYKVFRQRGSDTPVQLTTGALGAAARAFDDTQVDPSVEHTYIVRSVTALGDGFQASDTGWESFPAPTGVAASDGTFTDKVLVSWTPVEGAVAYSIWRAVGSATPTEVSPGGGVAATEFADTTAGVAVSYKYFVRTISSLGPSPLSASNTGYRGFLPPAEVAATDGEFSNKIVVSWSQASGATGYKVYRRVGAGTATNIATVQGGASVSFSDTSAPALTEVFYSLRTVTAVGTSEPSAETTGWRNSAAPSNVTASAGTSAESVAVAWTLPTGSTGCEVYRAVGSGGVKLIAKVGPVTGYSDSSADPLVAYKYTVKAVHAFGTSPASVAASGWRNAEPPTGVVASDGEFSNKIRVSWDAFPGSLGYKVYRKLASASGAAQLVATITSGSATGWDDTTAPAGKNYSYQVKARHALGFTGLSEAGIGWRNVAAPTGVAATDGTSSTQVTVTWNAVGSATGYLVFRQLGADEPVIIGERTASQPRSFADTGGVDGVEYRYSVAATCGLGQGARSTSNTGWRNLAKPTGVAASDGDSTVRVTITWEPVENATGYKVFRQFGTSQNMLVATVTGGDSTLATDEAVPPLTNAKYTVRALCTLGQSAASASNTGWRNREAPANVQASDGQYPDKVRITWLGVPNATKYRVYRQLGAEDPVVLGTVNGTLLSFYDTTIPLGETGTYFVQALHALGATGLSEPDTGFRETALALSAPTEGPAPVPGNAGEGDDAPNTDTRDPDTSAEPNDTAIDDAADPDAGDEESADDGCPACPASCARTIARLDALVVSLEADESADRSLIESLAALAAEDADGSIPACAMLRGDVDLDGTIDADDFAAFLVAWSTGDLVRADLNRDGLIDGEDFLRAAIPAGSANTP